ncbi:hypothetical protein HPB50_005927 [Hyalomma asiaticum]|uniref:Uncharacterized protein n=1 Tax=Hyalomma asiaticum TaxID=266040 RepID=A0ACB7T1K9_HYAAI|nr:hypothetical protein HPB50_005927 [Hyalomma asiaticum]
MAATNVTVHPPPEDFDSCKEHGNARAVPLEAPCTSGRGDEYGSSAVPSQPPWPSSGDGGDVAADQSQAESDNSTSTEYLTPAGSPLSLDFCSTFDIFPWEEEEQIPPPHLDQISGQRVGFRTTPSTVSLLSGSSSTQSGQRGYFVVQGYRSLSNSDSSSDRYSNTATSGSSYVRSTSPTPPRTPVRVVDPSALSTTKLIERWLEDPLEPHIEQRPRPTWARLWTGLCGHLRRLVTWRHNLAGRRRRAGRAGHRRRDPAGRRLCGTGQPESFLRDADDVFNNVSSDEFYTAGTRWGHVRRIYQRCVSYLHALWCRRGP